MNFMLILKIQMIQFQMIMIENQLDQQNHPNHSDQQNQENQKYEIEQFANANNLNIDKWIKETISSKKPLEERKLGKLIKKLKADDDWEEFKHEAQMLYSLRQ